VSAARIAVLDYGMGNRRSVHKALEHVGARVIVSGDPEAVRGADGLVVPGVGAFPQGMRNLRERGLDQLIRRHAGAGRPLLGICLGMQLLFDGSNELSPTSGLGLIAGEVSYLRAPELRLPHIGWNVVHPERPSPLLAGLPELGCAFYHVHSLVARPADPADVVGSTVYGERFASIVGRGNVLGVQFHPEKSSRDGLAMLRNFTGMCGSSAAGTPHRVGSVQA
jgi:glutamine amidotransferase